MSGYVIKRGAEYVARPGSARSYTRRLEHARIYPTREAANTDRCPENETVLPLAECFGR